MVKDNQEPAEERIQKIDPRTGYYTEEYKAILESEKTSNYAFEDEQKRNEDQNSHNYRRKNTFTSIAAAGLLMLLFVVIVTLFGRKLSPFGYFIVIAISVYLGRIIDKALDKPKKDITEDEFTESNQA